MVLCTAHLQRALNAKMLNPSNLLTLAVFWLTSSLLLLVTFWLTLSRITFDCFLADCPPQSLLVTFWLTPHPPITLHFCLLFVCNPLKLNISPWWNVAAENGRQNCVRALHTAHFEISLQRTFLTQTIFFKLSSFSYYSGVGGLQKPDQKWPGEGGPTKSYEGRGVCQKVTGEGDSLVKANINGREGSEPKVKGEGFTECDLKAIRGGWLDQKWWEEGVCK